MPRSLFFLEGGGGQADAIRRFDWSKSPLGPIKAWPGALKVAVGMMLSSRFPQCLVCGPHLITLYNDAFRPILGGKQEALGRPFSEIWSEAWSDIGPIVEKALQGEATFIEDYPLIIERHGYREQAHFTFCYSPVRDDLGHIVGMLDTVIETSRRVADANQAEVITVELAHRISNLMAVVGAIADQTLKAAEDLPSARSALRHRIHVLSQALTMVVRGKGGSAQVDEVVVAAFAAHGHTDQFHVSGPSVALEERQALALALAVNELATNAGKYGALSADGGLIEISWTDASAGPFRFNWIESGGPPVTPPGRRGFGSTLMEAYLSNVFGGQARLDFWPDGLRYRLETNSLPKAAAS